NQKPFGECLVTFSFPSLPETAHEAPPLMTVWRCAMNRQLKAEIVLRFGNQSDAAQAMGLPESRLSKIIHYRIPPSDKERRALARVFGRERANSLLGGEDRLTQVEDRPAGAGS